jgi:hypothetical protein
MNCSQKNSYRQIAMILGALVAGTVVTRVIPDVHPIAAYVQQTQTIPTNAVFKHANAKQASHNASRDLTGIDVDAHRLALLGRVS